MIPLLGRLAAWLQANPLWGLIAGLLAALGVAAARRRHLETRAREAQATADRMRMKLARASAEAHATRLEEQLAQEEKAAETARQDDTLAAGEAKTAGETLKDISKRWPTR